MPTAPKKTPADAPAHFAWPAEPQPSFFERIGRFGRTVRHLSASQMLTRLARRLDRAGWRLAGGALARRYAARARAVAAEAGISSALAALAARRLAREAGPAVRQSAEALRAGRFTFLNRTLELGRPVQWRAAATAGPELRLWRFQLGYFEWALDLFRAWRRTGRAGCADDFLALAGEFLNAVRPDAPGALDDYWHPYTVSRRAAAWALLLSADDGRPEAAPGWRDRRAALTDSLALHLDFLARHLERDLRANHLLSDARGLLLGAALFRGRAAERWRQAALGILRAELPEQVLADGGHVERSPMYHALVLEDLLDCLALLPAGTTEATALGAAVGRMADFLDGIIQPDGELPLLNDSALGLAAPAAELLAEARSATGATGRTASAAPAGPSARAFPETGLWVARGAPASGDFFVLDCGPLGPDYNPGHGHADFLGFELAHARQRFIVDAGAGEYVAGPRRAYARSLAAHSTVRLDGREPVELWGAFRVGRRGRARLLAQAETRDAAGPVFRALAEHDGWRRGRAGPPAVHRREVLVAPGEFWLVLDELAVPGDAEFGVESFLHFHPAVTVARAEASGAAKAPPVLRARRGAAGLGLMFFLPDHPGDREARLVLAEGRHFSGFGVEASNRVAVLAARGRGRLRLGLLILPEAPDGPPVGNCRLDWRADGLLELTLADGRRRTLPPLGPAEKPVRPEGGATT